jgi:hypothetical protein
MVPLQPPDHYVFRAREYTVISTLGTGLGPWLFTAYRTDGLWFARISSFFFFFIFFYFRLPLAE